MARSRAGNTSSIGLEGSKVGREPFNQCDCGLCAGPDRQGPGGHTCPPRLRRALTVLDVRPEILFRFDSYPDSSPVQLRGHFVFRKSPKNLLEVTHLGN